MCRFLILVILFFNTNLAYGYITYSGHQGYNNFSSKLNMNKPKVTVSDYRTPHYYRRNWHKPGYLTNGNYYRQSYRPIPINSLNKLEKYVFDKSYRNEDELSRLERLENIAFGAIQNGDIESRYRNVESAILSRPNHNYKRSIWSNIGSFLTGQATGITPSIVSQDLTGFDNFANYGNNMYLPGFRSMSGYGNSTFEQYSNGMFSGGWGNFHNNYGSGGSVKILD